ncbi:hypothetical protein [Yinghuangia sp. YIM S09857]|uniref:hypothetical protein n=1 Tax=Yinghuangia sp. YIM S09857 TaxID=3436929 RepID=UPI003F52D19E
MTTRPPLDTGPLGGYAGERPADVTRRADPPVWHRLFTGPIPAPAATTADGELHSTADWHPDPTTRPDPDTV